MAKKTNESCTDLEQLIDELREKNADLELDNGDLKKQIELLTQQNIKAEEKYIKEREHRREVQRENEGLRERVRSLITKIERAKSLSGVEQRKRHGSVPKFVIVAAIALVVLIGSFLLQKLIAIGPSVGYGIQCSMAMIISWCYAIIYDRSRKN